MNGSSTILAIDQGTTNSKAILVSTEGVILARGSSPVGISYPRTGWAEQDPLAIWQSVELAIGQCLCAASQRGIATASISAVGVTNQRETAIAWSRSTGQPLGPAIGWQCTRTTPFCAHLSEQGLGPLVEARTGLTLNPMFAGSKMRWLLNHLPTATPLDDVCLGTVDSWLIWNLTAGRVHACDWTNASRTQLFDLAKLAWDDELLGIFGIPRDCLPQCIPSSAGFGETTAVGGLPAGVPVLSAIGDSHGAMVGHGRYQTGTIKATYGTGSSLMSPSASLVHSKHGISSTIAWSLSGAENLATYGLEGNIYATGAAAAWMGNTLGLSNIGAELEAMARAVPDNGGVYFVPAFSGLGAPHWDEAAKGTITGLTGGATREYLARAAIESIALQIMDVFVAIASDTGADLTLLLADGGASANNLLMQFQADILDRPVERSASAELSALGAAYLAGIGAGIWRDLAEVEGLPHEHERFEPDMSASDRESLLKGWHDALSRARGRN